MAKGGGSRRKHQIATVPINRTTHRGHRTSVTPTTTPPIYLPYNVRGGIALDQPFLDPLIEDGTKALLYLQALGLGLYPESNVELNVCCHDTIIKRLGSESQSLSGDEEVPHHDDDQSHYAH